MAILILSDGTRLRNDKLSDAELQEFVEDGFFLPTQTEGEYKVAELLEVLYKTGFPTE